MTKKLTRVFDECLIASYGPIIVLGNLEKKNGSLGYGLFCSSQ